MSNDDCHKGVIAVFEWQYRNTGSFNNLLCTLYQKADPINKRLIAHAWPYVAVGMEMWEDAADCGDELFCRYGLMPSEK